MVDYHSQIVSALNTILPTHYEMALTKNTKTPCISYMELNNYSYTEGFSVSSTIGYSYLKYQIKIWGHNIGELQEYAIEVDKVLRPLGFKRVSGGELYDNNSTMIQKILTYEALALEEFN